METHGLRAIESLSTIQRLELVRFESTQIKEVLYALMDAMVELARNDAMSIPPHQQAERLAAMDTAYAMNKGFEDLKECIKVLNEQQFADTKLQLAKKALEDVTEVEKIITAQPQESEAVLLKRLEDQIKLVK